LKIESNPRNLFLFCYQMARP